MIKSKMMISKSDDFEIVENLYHSEVRCQCDSPLCFFTLLDVKMIQAWSRVRKAWGVPISVNSCYRCQSHNESGGGVSNSYHCVGSAIDVAFPDNPLDLNSFIRLCEKHFDFVKVYYDRKFLHLHIIK